MFAFWVRVLVFLYALWLLRRLIAFLSGAPKRRSTRTNAQDADRQPAGHTVKDPICGMYMDPRLAVRVDNGKGSFFFCSNECKEKYLSQSR
jgi:YHS domain-containing protein